MLSKGRERGMVDRSRGNGEERGRRGKRVTVGGEGAGKVQRWLV